MRSWHRGVRPDQELALAVAIVLVASTAALGVHRERSSPGRPATPLAAPVPPAPEPPTAVPSGPALPFPFPAPVRPLVPEPDRDRDEARAGRGSASAARRTTPAGPAAYGGLGAWIDVYDWSRTFTRGQPHTSPDDVDRMADLGVQTLYIQASKDDSPTDVLEADLLEAYLKRAKARRMRVVAWYLPTLVDPQRDLSRLVAISALPQVDSLAVDIESRDVPGVAERNRRLVNLSTALRQALPGRTVAAIVLPPVTLDLLSPGYWPSFPYRALAPSYDVWLTMGYWTFRPAGTPYRDAYRYTKENVERLRSHLGLPQVPVHPIGGIGDRTSAADVEGFRRAVVETGSVGASLYDWRTTRGDVRPALQGLRR